MASKSPKRNSPFAILEELRLLVAGEIICYCANTRDEQTHISYDAASNELFDQYSLKIFLLWLAYKYGFPAYTDAMYASNQAHLATFDRWASLTNRYPFYSYFEEQFEKRLQDLAFELLDNRLEPRLDFMGVLYMQTMISKVARGEDRKLYMEKIANGRRGGEFYTAGELAQRCIRQPFSEDLIVLTNELKRNSDRWKTRYNLLDPACGCGNFLLAAVELFRVELAGALLPAARTVDFARHCLHGCDVDMRAISICRMLLLIALSPEFKQLSKDLSVEEFQEFVASFMQDVEQNVRCSDPISRLPQEPYTNDGFDFVVTNPPYVSYGSRNQPELHTGLSRYLRQNFVASAEYKIRLHSIFQELCVRACRAGGKVVMLVPDAFLNGAYYTKLRAMLLQECRIDQLVELPETTFADAVAGRWCIATYTKNSDVRLSSDYTVRLIREDSAGAETFDIPLSHLVSRDKARFQMVFNETDSGLLQRLSGLAPVSAQYRGYTGIRSRSGQAAIVAESRRTGGNWCRGITSGGNVSAHRVAWTGKWLDVTPEKLFAGGFNPDVINNVKLLVRQTADRLIGGVDRDGLYHLNNVHSFAPQPASSGDMSPSARLRAVQFLDGLLNSRLWLHLYQLKSREKQRALAQIDIEMVESLPLPEPNAELEEAIVTIVNAASVCPIDRLEDMNRALDRLVFDMYNLSPQEIQHIENVSRSTISSQNNVIESALPTRYEACKLVEFCLQSTM